MDAKRGELTDRIMKLHRIYDFWFPWDDVNCSLYRGICIMEVSVKRGCTVYEFILLRFYR